MYYQQQQQQEQQQQRHHRHQVTQHQLSSNEMLEYMTAAMNYSPCSESPSPPPAAR
jgi:hypothetical protein